MILPDRNPPSATLVREVAGGDVDASAIVHFARYPDFAEAAALTLLEQHGCGPGFLAGNGLDLRVRELRTSYRAPARCRDLLKLQAAPAWVGRAHLRIAVRTTRAFPETEEAIAITELDLVFYDVRRGQPTLVPPALAEALRGGL